MKGMDGWYTDDNTVAKQYTSQSFVYTVQLDLISTNGISKCL